MPHDAPRLAAQDRWILHFTHLDNLAMIRSADRLVCDVGARDGLIRTEVGDPEIKEARRRRPVPIAPYGRVGDYVPFYFAPRSPMMYRIACDHRDSVAGRYPHGDRPLVYLVATVGLVIDSGARWVATDGNAATATTAFSTDVGQLDAMIDWPLMTAGRWHNTADDPDRQRRRMAELLVHRELPLSAIHQVGTYNGAYASSARAILRDHRLAQRVVVRPNWYYGFTPRG